MLTRGQFIKGCAALGAAIAAGVRSAWPETPSAERLRASHDSRLETLTPAEADQILWDGPEVVGAVPFPVAGPWHNDHLYYARLRDGEIVNIYNVREGEEFVLVHKSNGFPVFAVMRGFSPQWFRAV